MKKYMPVLFSVVFAFIFISFFGFNVNFASAASLPAGCTSTTAYSSTTGKPCNAATFPSGCTSAVGYSPTTGVRCDLVIYTSLPYGCASTSGFSPKTGQPCGTAHLPYGCTSTLGYSGQTGAKCDISTYHYLPGCDSFSGVSSTTYNSCNISDNKSPVISELNGSRILRINQTGTWTLSAYDPNGGDILYEIDWGQGAFTSSTSSASIPFAQQYVTFSHAYREVGKYGPIFTVRNYNGDMTQQSVSVEVK